MLDTDTLLMQLSLELARQGAGLVSPNPLVGAVLVKEGEVVGEGYHRYDLLKHAEAYAIETAGDRARGATLYCNLEPCCHHGRTPPCTDALIEAGIARAVIAIKDPDPRVSGRGIEQLRKAGIDVEIGLLNDRALQLNESYFKFITTGTPFVHAVIEYPGDQSMTLGDWHPTSGFLESVSVYDGLMTGDRASLNRLMLKNALSRDRYRPLVVAAGDGDSKLLAELRERTGKGISLMDILPDPSRLDSGGNVVQLEAGISRGVAHSPVHALLRNLSIKNVTSLLVLPGRFDLSEPSNFQEIDKATLVLHGALSEGAVVNPWAFGDVEFDLEDVIVAAAGGFTELTGYPALREVA